MTEAVRRREYLFTVRCSNARSGCGFTQDVPPLYTYTHTHTRTHTPPVFLISTLTLQSPGLIKKGKCVIAEEGFGLLRGRAGCIVQEAGPGYSRRRAHSARLPAWPGRRHQSQHRSPREKELAALGMRDLTQIGYRTWGTLIKVKGVAV